MKRISLVLIVTFLLLLPFTLEANAQGVITITKPITQPVSSATNDQVIILQAQLETMKDYDQRLINTVYWTLGTVITVVLAIVGASWIVNFRLYDRDKEAMKRELKVELEAIGQSLTELVKTTTSTEIDHKLDQTQKVLKISVDRSILQVSSKLKDVETELVYARIAILENEIERLNERDSFYAAVSLNIDIIEIALKANVQWKIAPTLENIETILLKNNILSADCTQRLTETLATLPPNYSIQAEKIRVLLSKTLPLSTIIKSKPTPTFMPSIESKSPNNSAPGLHELLKQIYSNGNIKEKRVKKHKKSKNNSKTI